MASCEFDNVKVEKEDALWRYNMERNLRIGLSFVGFLLVLFLLSVFLLPSLIPPTVEIAGDFRRYSVSTFNKPLFSFILVNIIILAVYVLSNRGQIHKQTAGTDIYDEYVSSRPSVPMSATDETMVDKQMILVKNAAALLSPVKQQRTASDRDTITETKRSVSPVKQPPTEDRTDPTQVIKQKEYRRCRSMVSESRNQRTREFRRSETTMISRELVISDTEPPRTSMDEMSSEEFQLIIDSFIADKKKTLMRENNAHYTEMKEKCMSIVVKS
ncbi:CYP722 protein [Hibiscus syriacus]|uniref:CYP722 protein n=1 Tax=Hibiscus syriacus TaxID=106335 RepID=A0A6A3BL28_HIBSY|nr:uncharacterized protein LOC120216768 [Hibiscus syriacus]KAE8715529.1 CYP722 protein [Hibiscus syriacus]